MLEKPGVYNTVVCEKQGKQHKLSDHWKSIKTFLLKKIQGMMLKRAKDWLEYKLQQRILHPTKSYISL